MSKEVVLSDKAPAPIGPYSHGVVTGRMVFTSGQAGLDPQTKKLAAGGVAAETRQTLENLRSILEAAGCTLADVVSTNVYMTDLTQFAEMNRVYGEFFRENPPARTTVQVAGLPLGASVEISCVAVRPE